VNTNTKGNGEADRLAAAREGLRAFAQHYDYDVSYLEALMEASPGTFFAFEGAMNAGRFQKAAPTELLAIAKITALRTEDCGPCTELSIKMAREKGVPDAILRGALHGGKGLSPEHLEIHQYARAVAANEEMDPDLLPRLEARWGREVMAELALAIVGARIYPTIKRALGYAKSCSLIPGLLA
jgi:alkylhydroperoxidase family enzyme